MGSYHVLSVPAVSCYIPLQVIDFKQQLPIQSIRSTPKAANQNESKAKEVSGRGSKPIEACVHARASICSLRSADWRRENGHFLLCRGTSRKKRESDCDPGPQARTGGSDTLVCDAASDSGNNELFHGTNYQWGYDLTNTG